MVFVGFSWFVLRFFVYVFLVVFTFFYVFMVFSTFFSDFPIREIRTNRTIMDVILKKYQMFKKSWREIRF